MFGKKTDTGTEVSSSTEAGFVRVAKVRDVRPGQIREGTVGKTKLALTNINGQFYAFAAHCPHQGWPLWSGDMKGELVRCYLHRWQFNVRTGKNVAPGVPVCLPTYPVKVEGDYLLVSVLPSENNS
ncbi:MAG TPA: Rieske 2Fe-2S domain-containing protein [Chloroflexia bacterium]|nr:Rieske 2Fe-2S domain-containing protein [Chloroflexia bacterium]